MEIPDTVDITKFLKFAFVDCVITLFLYLLSNSEVLLTFLLSCCQHCTECVSCVECGPRYGTGEVVLRSRYIIAREFPRKLIFFVCITFCAPIVLRYFMSFHNVIFQSLSLSFLTSVVKMGGKRQVPSLIQNILKLDVKLTNNFCLYANNILPLRALRIHYKLLEISCHGIPWFCTLLAFIWLWDDPNLYQMQVNLFYGLVIDIIIIAVVKALTRRRRPSSNTDDMFATMGPDKFSFPSGHASRAAFIAYFFINLWPFPSLLRLPLLAWSISVCISRVLLQRHHLLDVTAGAVLGILEGILISLLWLSQDSCRWLISWLSDERIDGGSYHV